MRLPQALMNRAIKPLAGFGLAMSLLFATPGFSAEEKVLNVYNWSDYIDESVIKDFTKKTGIKVNYDVFDSNELLETKLLAGSSGYDLVVPSAAFLQRQIKAGVFEKLDKSKLPNLKNVWDVIAERTEVYDKDLAHSTNYLWGTTGIGYVKEKIDKIMKDAPVDSWELVLNPEIASKFADCGIHWLDSPVEVLPQVLKYMGKETDTTKLTKEDLAAAEAVINKVRPYIKKFHSSEYISALANGDICIAIGWSGDIFQAQTRAAEAKNGVTVEYSIPKEGTQMWFDMLAIPVDAKHKEEAYAFINYLLEPEVIAKVSNYVAYANGNKASQEFIDKAILENPSIYPTDEVMKGLFTVLAYDGKIQRMVNRTWTRLKSGK